MIQTRRYFSAPVFAAVMGTNPEASLGFPPLPPEISTLFDSLSETPNLLFESST